jgi:hypothetical protein
MGCRVKWRQMARISSNARKQKHVNKKGRREAGLFLNSVSPMLSSG